MQALCDWLHTLQSELGAADMRAPVIWQARADILNAALPALVSAGGLWLHSGGDTPLRPPPGAIVVEPNQAQHYLGDEYPMLVVDGFSGVDADMLLMLAGTLTPGAVALMLLPPACPGCPNGALSRFLSHGQTLPAASPWLARLLGQPGAVAMGEPWRLPAPTAADAEPPAPPLPDANTVVLISGRRGRGKSTLLAELADRHDARRIALVTNHARALGSLRRHLLALGWEAPRRGVPLKFSKPDFSHPQKPPKTLEILPPDAFLAQKAPCELLLIDEAARLTLPVLQKLLQTPCPIALATTQEGYEGAGQGLRLKLAQQLPPGKRLRTLPLTTPRRWAHNDPLERWLDGLCLLDVPLPAAPVGALAITPWRPQAEDPDLAAAWALLKTAHYQTRPNDLMQLLDRPGQRLWRAANDTGTGGVLWTLEEGGLEDVPSHVRGHLAAQRLRQLTGDETWLKRRSLRITRIAVHPDRQGEGVGTALIERLKREADVDFLSVSCAAEPRLLRFWERQGFALRHVGERPNRASGLPSALLVYE